MKKPTYLFTAVMGAFVLLSAVAFTSLSSTPSDSFQGAIDKTNTSERSLKGVSAFKQAPPALRGGFSHTDSLPPLNDLNPGTLDGGLLVTEASTTATKQLLGGDDDTTNILSVQLKAQYEDVRIEQLNFAATAPETSIAYLNVYLNGATTPIVAANTSCSGLSYGGGNLYCADEDFELTNNVPVTIEVHPVLKSESEGGTSGDPIVIALLATGITGGDSVEAYGVTSNNLIPAPVTTTIVSANHMMVFAKIDGVANANADGDSSTTISVGNNPFGVFEFTTADNVNGADVELNQLTFDVTSTNVAFTAGSFVMYEEGRVNNDVICTETATTGNFTVNCTGLMPSDVDSVLEEDDAYVFVLEGEVADNAVDSGVISTLQASITNFTDPTATSYGASVSHFDWTDSEDSSPSSVFWIDFPATSVESTAYGTTAPAQCNNNIDDDNDGWIDFPADSGCADAQDDNEAN